LQDAKARFGELVRRVRREGPQTITVQGRDEVVVVAADQYRREGRERTGADLVAALRSSPRTALDLRRPREQSPVRDVEL
jgi:prevent-host-death family protein